MPIINKNSRPSPSIVFAGGSAIAIDSTFTARLKATIAGRSNLFANGTELIVVSAPAHIGGGSGFAALGRIDDEPNLFGLAEIGGGSSVSLNGRKAGNALGVLRGNSGFRAGGSVAAADVAAMNVFLTIGPRSGVGFGGVYSARIAADGQAYKLKSYRVNEGRAESGVSLDCTFQRPADRAAVMAAESFDFEIYENGDWVPIFSAGRRTAGTFAFSWGQGRPSDQLGISTAAPVKAQLERSPRRNLTVYDSTRESIDAAAYRDIYDENGVRYQHELRAVADLTLGDLLRFVFVEKCGFADVKTTIPTDWNVRRFEAQMTDTFAKSVAGYVGPFDPLPFVVDNVYWLLDSTLAIPEGFIDAIPTLTADQWSNAQFRVVEQDADGFIVQYVENDTAFDRFQDREVEDDTEPSGEPSSDDYTETDRSRVYRDWFKDSNPFVPVETKQIEEREQVRGYNILPGGGRQFTTISDVTERTEYDAKLRLQSIRKATQMLIPQNVPAGDAYPRVFREIETETSEYEYRPDPNDPRREYLSSETTKVSGYIITDSEKLHLGVPYKQRFVDAWEGGNLSDSQSVSTGRISELKRKITVQKSGQTEVRQRHTNFLTNPPKVTTIPTAAQGGDITSNAVYPAAAETIVYRTGLTDRTDARLRPFPIAELPIRYGRPLAKRKLDKRQRLTGTIELKGLRLAFGRGSVFRLLDRDGGTVGFFLTEGRSIAGDNLGTRQQRTKQILEVLEVSTAAEPLTIATSPPGALSAAAGETIEFSMYITGRTGYSLTADVGGAAVQVRAKAFEADNYQNIVTHPINTGPFNGKPWPYRFQVQVDALAANGNHIIRILSKQI